MNVLEAWFEGRLGYPVNWDATGTWMGAAATAAAVYLAATLTERANKKSSRDLWKQRYRALTALYIEAAEHIEAVEKTSVRDEKGRRSTPPSVVEFDDILAALDAVPILELGNEAAIVQLFQVKRCLMSTRDLVVSSSPHEWNEPIVEALRRASKLCRKVAEGGRHAAKVGAWPKQIGDRWLVVIED